MISLYLTLTIADFSEIGFSYSGVIISLHEKGASSRSCPHLLRYRSGVSMGLCDSMINIFNGDSTLILQITPLGITI